MQTQSVNIRKEVRQFAELSDSHKPVEVIIIITRIVASVSAAMLRPDDDDASAMCRPSKVFASYSCWPSFVDSDIRKLLRRLDSMQLAPPGN